ncbi:DUF3800 domain-containing protein [Veillonella caviae]|uniref:DUF3800 domain-containing protein n=1 Tax=Veillonella caviae TaxID=248316 RepID=UPI002A9166CB|nr:DUF3800 domain-containing protein [Veillonella caviae]MDY5253961.1 DUF3800 domain-containing protein [Veillonella caviae]
MNIYVYSDESGVFDKEHNDIFVFSGVICIGNDEKEKTTRKYIHAEKTIRKSNKYKVEELKACCISNKDKGKLFRSMNQAYKFAVVVKQKNVLDRIFKSKKDKQRFLDYAYKRGVKNALKCMLEQNIIQEESVENLYFYVDEHSTATNGKYELKETLESEFKYGTYNRSWDVEYPPLFNFLKSVNVEFCNSKHKYLVRASDIVANRIYYLAIRGMYKEINQISNLYTIILP